VFRNRIINGAMVIDQRNAGSAVTISANANSFTLDRFRCDAPVGQSITVQQVVDAPSGFYNSLKYTTGTASTNASDASQIFCSVEGLNTTDLNWGTSSAQSITLSFWAKSSLSGTFGLTMENSAQNRCYVTSYSLPTANTWTYITKTILGDTTGTWLTNNGRGIVFRLDMGVGTSASGAVTNAWSGAYYNGTTGVVKLTQNTGATFNITGVQLEKGSTATSFDYRPYGTELALCQRYFQKYGGLAAQAMLVPNMFAYSTTSLQGGMVLPVVMRVTPAISVNAVQVSNAILTAAASGNTVSTGSENNNQTINFWMPSMFTGLTAGVSYWLATTSTAGFLKLDSEL
jgi:hypothetical protein